MKGRKDVEPEAEVAPSEETPSPVKVEGAEVVISVKTEVRFVMGDKEYHFKPGKEYKVPRDVKENLRMAGNLK